MLSRPVAGFSRVRRVSWLVVCGVLLLAGCGGSGDAPGTSTSVADLDRAAVAAAVPAPGGPAGSGGVVVRVGGMPITRSQLESRMAVMATSSSAPEGIVPVPPGFSGCIKGVERAAISTRAAPPTATGARAQCAAIYKQLVGEALKSLISGEWVIGWARELGVRVSDQEARRALEQLMATEFHSEANLRQFMVETHDNVYAMLFKRKVALAEAAIRARVKAKVGPVTNATLVKYYAENPARFHVNEQRDLGIVRTDKGAAAAARIERELAGGVSYAVMAKRLASEQPVYADDGRLTGIEPHTFAQESVNHAIFSAKPGVVIGPVQVQLQPHSEGHTEEQLRHIDGYYIFTVQKILPAHQVPLAQVKPALLRTLPALLEAHELSPLTARLSSKWRALTDCSHGFVVRKCRQFRPAPGEPPEAPETLG
jgi:parvulin-like peptidyl-prolyl isomerase